MKKIFKALNFTGIFLFITVSFIACDKDFSTVESDVLGEGNINFNTDKVTLPIIAYNKKLDFLQINNLSSNLLGVFNDPVYGQTTASIITQVAPSGYGPDFGDNPVIDSVVLSIPYFSRALTDSTYTISDSLYGNAPIHLSVYKNNYFLRDFDPNSPTNAQQNYYSKADGSINGTDNFAMTDNTIINFDANKGELLIDTTYVPSSKAIVTVTTDEEDKITKTRSAPALRYKLDPAFWKTTIIDKQGQPELSNENNFKNYFRGLYFKAEALNPNAGSLVLLNLASTDSKITIYYSFDDTGTPGERTQSNYILNLASTSSININRLNTFINNYDIPLANGNKTLGDEKLYLKGTEGSMAVVDLFAGMVECQNPDGSTSIITALECFKKTYRKLDENGNYLPPINGEYSLKGLINEARLVIYEDESMINSTDHKYDRIYAYDVKNNIPTVDYLFDPITNTSNPLSSKIVSLGQRDPDQLKYKIRLTEHLNSILIRDSTNTKIGLVLSSNVNITNNSKILNSNDAVTGVPSVSIITPRGTILHGTHNNVPENKKMKLEIFFTKPK